MQCALGKRDGTLREQAVKSMVKTGTLQESPCALWSSFGPPGFKRPNIWAGQETGAGRREVVSPQGSRREQRAPAESAGAADERCSWSSSLPALRGCTDGCSRGGRGGSAARRAPAAACPLPRSVMDLRVLQEEDNAVFSL